MIALPTLAILASGWCVLLLMSRLADHVTSALHPDAVHDARTSDRALALTCALALCLIALSLWVL